MMMMISLSPSEEAPLCLEAKELSKQLERLPSDKLRSFKQKSEEWNWDEETDVINKNIKDSLKKNHHYCMSSSIS